MRGMNERLNIPSFRPRTEIRTSWKLSFSASTLVVSYLLRRCLLLRCANFGAFFANTVADDNQQQTNETREVSDLEARVFRDPFRMTSFRVRDIAISSSKYILRTAAKDS